MKFQAFNFPKRSCTHLGYSSKQYATTGSRYFVTSPAGSDVVTTSIQRRFNVMCRLGLLGYPDFPDFKKGYPDFRKHIPNYNEGNSFP